MIVVTERNFATDFIWLEAWLRGSTLVTDFVTRRKSGYRGNWLHLLPGLCRCIELLPRGNWTTHFVIGGTGFVLVDFVTRRKFSYRLCYRGNWLPLLPRLCGCTDFVTNTLLRTLCYSGEGGELCLTTGFVTRVELDYTTLLLYVYELATLGTRGVWYKALLP